MTLFILLGCIFLSAHVRKLSDSAQTITFGLFSCDWRLDELWIQSVRMMENRVFERSQEHKESPQVFTYFQGDINTAVDEHFFRALNKATIPKDLSTKAKESNRTLKDTPSSSWAFSGITWSKPTHSSSKLTQLSSIEPQAQSQGVIVNPSGLSSSSLSTASSVWPCPPRQSSSFELPPLVYQQPPAGPESTSSYLNLLQIDRPAGGLMMPPFVKSENRSEWNSGTAFKDVSGSRIGLDSGVSVSEINKDLYWY
ncbi:hypothetical protein DNTS_022835 [Danionella cerebrum]|uniref:Transcription cofactor vestigial-like protein 1 n=1 Tax=Danionella cerebrum TaxID=2873325 RepID=A0A553RAS3_9TELE|nr:hypothetical protein DNTS_022835 [Danionella translucida]